MARVALCLLVAFALTGWPLWLLVALGCVMSTFQALGAPAFISIVNDLVPPRAVAGHVHVRPVLGEVGLDVAIRIAPDRARDRRPRMGEHEVPPAAERHGLARLVDDVGVDDPQPPTPAAITTIRPMVPLRT